MAQVWPNRFKNAAAVQAIYGRGQCWQLKAFDDIYGGRIGNRKGTSDGSHFIGRGGPQVTGRDGYDEVGQRAGIDLVNNPDAAAKLDMQPEICAAVEQTGILIKANETLQSAQDMLGTITTIATTIIGVAQWCFAHWWMFALGGGVNVSFRVAMAVLNKVVMFKQGVFARAGKRRLALESRAQMPEWIASILQQYGLAGAVILGLVVLLIRSDNERREAQAKLTSLSVDTVKAMNTLQITVQSIKDLMAGRQGG